LQRRLEPAVEIGRQGLERRVARMKRGGEPALGNDEVDKALQPPFERFFGRIGLRERGRGVLRGDLRDPESLRRGAEQAGAVIQRITWAYLKSARYPDDTAWSTITSETETGSEARIESK